TMNPSLPQSVVDAAMEEDLQSALSEYMGEFRDDIAAYLPREVIEQLVVKGRTELLYERGREYFAFADVSGGRGDDAALAIAHREKRTVVLDVLRRYKPPFDPRYVVKMMCDELRNFRLRRCTGDAFGADFVSRAFRDNGIFYEKSELPKSGLYLE